MNDSSRNTGRYISYCVGCGMCRMSQVKSELRGFLGFFFLFASLLKRMLIYLSVVVKKNMIFLENQT